MFGVNRFGYSEGYTEPCIGSMSSVTQRVDREGIFPDPRSLWQPGGVHNASRWMDHNGFHWSDQGWQQPPLGSAVIYELHVGTYTSEGTFDALINKLDHLTGLGVTHVELMPVAEFSGRHGWGYDGVYLYAPHQAYGGPDGLKRLVNACHGRGLAMRGSGESHGQAPPPAVKPASDVTWSWHPISDGPAICDGGPTRGVPLTSVVCLAMRRSGDSHGQDPPEA